MMRKRHEDRGDDGVPTVPKKGRMGARRDVRESNAALVAVEALSDLGTKGRMLVVDDDTDSVGPSLRDAGAEVTTWYRRAAGDHHAQAWPNGDEIDVAVIRYPVARKAFDMLVHATAALLTEDGCIVTYGANDEGIKGAAGALRKVFSEVEVLATKKHSRVLRARHRRDVPCKRTLAEWKETVTFELESGTAHLVSYPSLFAHGKLDAGTKMLLGNLPRLGDGARVLDYGCGIGVIGYEVHRRNPSASIDLIDVDAIAVEAAKENVPSGTVYLADRMDAVRDERYDLVVSNPPIHSGKGEDFTVLLRFLEDAKRTLTKGGSVVFVVQATVPLRAHLRNAYANVDAVETDGRYTVWRCS